MFVNCKIRVQRKNKDNSFLIEINDEIKDKKDFILQTPSNIINLHKNINISVKILGQYNKLYDYYNLKLINNNLENFKQEKTEIKNNLEKIEEEPLKINLKNKKQNKNFSNNSKISDDINYNNIEIHSTYQKN